MGSRCSLRLMRLWRVGSPGPPLPPNSLAREIPDPLSKNFVGLVGPETEKASHELYCAWLARSRLSAGATRLDPLSLVLAP